MDYPILYSFRRCPYAMRARLALVYANIQVELREVVLRDKPAELLELSPKATVPVLQLLDGEILEESIDIMLWALEQHDPDYWYQNRSPAQQAEMRMLIKQNDGEFKYYLDRYKYADRYPEHDEIYYRQQGEKFLKQLETSLSKTNYLFGDQISFADMAILPFIRQFAFADKDWFNQAPYPNIQRWLDEFLDSPLFQTIMPKFPAWQTDDPVTLFPN
jgi:glutathione S-transferase